MIDDKTPPDTKEYYNNDPITQGNSKNIREDTPPLSQEDFKDRRKQHFENPHVNCNHTDEYCWSFTDYENIETSSKPKEKNYAFSIFTTLMIAVLGLGAVGLSGYGAYMLITDYTRNEKSTVSEATDEFTKVSTITVKENPLKYNDENVNSDGLSTVEIIKKVMPSVATVTWYSDYNSYVPSGSISGIITSADGYVVTNAHILDGALGINVELNNGESYAAEIIGNDDKTNIALLKIQAENLTFAEFGNSEDVDIGERVIAIGNINGAGTTQGIVSGVGRLTRDSECTTDFIQIDAPITNGNMGGALVNSFGQIIGINSLTTEEKAIEGIGLAVPTHVAENIINEIIDNGFVANRIKIGFDGNQVSQVAAQINDVPTGVVILSVDPYSSLNNENVIKGDIITHINDNRIESFEDIAKEIENKVSGDTIEIKLHRSSELSYDITIDITIELVEDVEESIESA